MPRSRSSASVARSSLRNPRPGSRIEAAKNYGVDLTLLIEQLRLTPAERISCSGVSGRTVSMI
jgi:hypothetical protein